MKRILMWLLLVCIVLSLVACGSAKDDPADSSSAPTTAITTTPTTVPTTVSTIVPTAANIEITKGQHLFFAHYGYQPTSEVELDLTQCTIDHLYCYDKNTKALITVYDNPIVCHTTNDINVYFVKLYEPTKIYAASITNPTQHTVIYESTHGAIDSLTTASDVEKYKNTALQFTEGGQTAYLA